MKTPLQISIFFIVALFILAGAACYAQQPLNTLPSGEQPQFPEATANAGRQLTYTIIPAANDTWGYEIFAEGKLLISQKSIPALPGNDGFKEQAQAMQVAELVMQKIRNGEMPPTVTVEELNALGIK
ncbi:MAG: DUF4907 domain-containing protein [Chitinophagaceae bacterium]|nr:DUF4907 domain-containing protein [Chitinophagaceae bacterium]